MKKSDAVKSIINAPYYNRGYEKANKEWLERINKIRNEIELMNFDFNDYYDHTDTIIEMVCKVIDKYIEESKETEE